MTTVPLATPPDKMDWRPPLLKTVPIAVPPLTLSLAPLLTIVAVVVPPD